MKKRPNLLLNLIFLVIWIFAFRKLWLAGMLAYGDTMPGPENIRQAFEAFFSSWQPLSRGIFFTQSMITSWQAVILVPFFKWPNIAQHIFNFLPFLLSFIFLNLLLVKVVPSKIARFLASFFYAVNPVTIGTFIGGATGMLYVHAFFPALVYSFWQLYESIYLSQNKSKILSKLLIFVLIFALAYSFGIYVIFLFLPVALFFLIKLLFSKNWKYFLILGVLYAIAMLSCLVLTSPISYYALPIISSLVGKGTGGLDVATLFQELKTSYDSNPLLDIGLGGTYLVPSLSYLHSVYFLGFFIPFLCLLAPLAAIDRRQKNWSIFFIIFALLILIFIFLTHQGFTLSLFLKMPGFLVFRSPAKLILLMAFAYSILLAISINGFLSYISTKWQKIYLIIVMSFIFIYSWPFFVGDMTLPQAKKDLSNFVIPKHYYEISNFLKEKRQKEGYFRTVWLPFTYESTEIKIHWLDEDAFFLPLGWSQHGQSDMDQFTQSGLKAVAQCNKNLGKFLAPAAVKYLVVDLKQNYPSTDLNGHYLKEPVEQIQKCFDSQKDLELIYSTQNYAIYQNKSFKPLLSAYFDKPPEDWAWDKKIPSVDSDTKIKIQKQSLTKYVLEIENEKSVYLVLSQPYHEGWQAKIGNQQLKHSPAFWQNGFFVNTTGTNKVEIYYVGQKIKNVLNVIFVISWLIWLTLFIKFKILKRTTQNE